MVIIKQNTMAGKRKTAPRKIKKSKLSRGELTLKMLDAIAKLTTDTLSLFIAASMPGSLNYNRMERNFVNLSQDNNRLISDFVASIQERKKFNNLLYKLKREGLVRSSEKGWLLTKLGSQKLIHLKKKNIYRKKYKKETARGATIFIFDIPETERHKRSWIRMVLKTLGFKMIQKSVWKGNAKLPKEFIKDLHVLKLLPHCVEIFSIKEGGTLF